MAKTPRPPRRVPRRNSGKGVPRKKSPPRRGKRVTLEDSVRAALIAAVCIFAATFAAFVVFVALPSAGPSAPIARPSDPPPDAPSPQGPDRVVLEPPPSAPPTPPPAPPEPRAAPELPERAPAPAPAPRSVPPERVPPPERNPPPARVPAARTLPPAQPPRPAPEFRGDLVIVIDDAGNNLAELGPFLDFPGPLTVAVLPGLPWSAEAARRIRAAGKELMLHQPMEASGGQDPGPGAIYADMSAAEIRRVLARNLDEVGPVAGLNNHQGSFITQSEEAMEAVLSVCRERGIFFLDSRTTAGTVAPLVAGRLGMEIGERDVFLDNVPDRAAMLDSLRAGLGLAARQGRAVMIGHAWSPALAALLAEEYPRLLRQGYSFSVMSGVLRGAAR